MPPKNAKPTSDELLAQFDDLGVDTEDLKTEPKAATTTKAAAPPEQDPLAELNDLVSQRPASRAATPRLSSELPHRPSPKLTSAATPPAGRTSEDAAAPRKSTETGRTSREAPSEPAPQRAEETPQSQGGGWWGSIFSTASAAVKQAEAAVKEIQKNEEAQKWAEQLRGNVGSLRELGGELRTLAIPTFTNLLHTLAPPISSHERLQVHITHDLSGYPEIDPIVHAVFARVMSQVEGGDLLVVQRGQESGPKRGGADSGYLSSAAGWHDGPWWRTVTPGNPRTISAVKGAVEGTKLARASAEAYASEYFSSRGGVEEAAKHATEVLSESNPVRSSDIFLAIQAINQTTPKDLFQAGPTTEKATPKGAVEVEDDKENEEVFFALYLHDPIHGIAFHTLSQAIPQKWIDWLDAPAPAAANADSVDAEIPHTVVPDSIAEIIESGGVDPREWVSEWVEESLSLAIGVVAQRYVARRMGVGEGGINKGKMRAEKTSTVESGAGEAARAL
ncbi:hypothetical protein DTO164E3_4132 [Paecilomyces variotii]|uniref:Maintenance of telomere capping protein 1 n=1 Tax=Byssochlamys spectabilis TaxID=264951 RepID=A0A443HX40_BYSSP|nr:maintenance of telomere capping protein 1 [Paecilomyces variotii]KAJ9194540.1 hypothetical protein DTO032I3_7344 [Paecilomyces variotii]KAJ9200121.1 hypothetical protein DTO164E3_4132 [Paecilomyces variotii]KAJ9268067.1 hypothetical protein DTO195F2_401 [Paecilomyces variotii]KAJ9281943.1 hypothetical protein DTO021D3_1239 [Paecilomyces variotii]KAJ9285146.1 hypothetical protein DTO021C3_7305 [Paecilomyces variotii]